MSKIIISVVIPICNVASYIERCIRSVMNQTYDDFECILVDDASPDDSIVQCERMVAEYQGGIRFKVIHHEQNRGLSAARNTGTDAAKGDFILYVDSDDEITKDCLEKLVAPVLRDKTIDMVVGNVDIVYHGYKQNGLRTQKHDCENLTDNESIRHCFFEQKRMNYAAWNKLIRKDFINRYGLSFKEGVIWEDTLWTFYVMKHLDHLYLLKGVTYLYYKHSHSITTSTNKETKQFYRGLIFNEISNNFTPGDGSREAKYYLWWFCCLYFQGHNEELSKETFQNFRKAQPFKNAPIEYFFVPSMGLLANARIGRNAFHGMRYAYKLIIQVSDVPMFFI